MATNNPNLDAQLVPQGSGIHINPEYSTSIPNSVFFDPKFWLPEAGGRPPSVYAVIVYGWCISKTTDIFTADDGVKYGRVLGGREIKFSLIAENLGISWGAVQSNMEHLVKVGLIYRVRSSAMKEYRYFVIDCQKKFKDKPKEGELPKGTGKMVKGKMVYPKTPAVSKEEMDFLDESKSTVLNFTDEDADLSDGPKTTNINFEDEEGDLSDGPQEATLDLSEYGDCTTCGKDMLMGCECSSASIVDKADAFLGDPR
jgi:hypothetical protein